MMAVNELLTARRGVTTSQAAEELWLCCLGTTAAFF
jgi:hypothetical protein